MRRRTTCLSVGLYCALLINCASSLRAQSGGDASNDTPPDRFRTWSDATGDFHVEAALRSVRDGRVVLERKDGALVTLAIEKLSAADQELVKIAMPQAASKAPAKSDAPPPEAVKPPPKKDEPKAPPDPALLDLHKRAAQAYLDGKWEEIQSSLVAVTDKQLATLPADVRGELVYIRKTIAECRPDWWEESKKGHDMVIRQTLWGKPFRVDFNPSRDGVSVEVINNPPIAVYSVGWKPDDMDNAKQAEHGYTKGELMNLGVWSNLGTALGYAQLPLRSIVNLSAQDNMALQRYLNFRGNLTGLHYGTPRARRWGEFLYMLMWNERYAKMEIRNSRRATSSMFLVELLTNPTKYPSIPLPASLPAEITEEKLASQVRTWIEKHGWTVAEDKALREAIFAFAAVNEVNVLQTQRVTLPNKLFVALDPDADEQQFRVKRDAWLKQQFDKVKK